MIASEWGAKLTASMAHIPHAVALTKFVWAIGCRNVIVISPSSFYPSVQSTCCRHVMWTCPYNSDVEFRKIEMLKRPSAAAKLYHSRGAKASYAKQYVLVDFCKASIISTAGKC